MLRVKTRLADYWYTLQDDRDENGNPLPDATRFKLAPLTTRQQLELADMTKEDANGDFVMTAEGFLIACKGSIKAWENVVDDRGKPLKFSPWSIEKQLPLDVIVELGQEIMMQLQAGDDEKKQSGSQ